MSEKLVKALAKKKVIVRSRPNVSAEVMIHFFNTKVKNVSIKKGYVDLLKMPGVTIAELKNSNIKKLARYLDFKA